MVVAVVLVEAARGGGESKRVMTLERAFPVEERVGLEVIIARDSARHARTLQSFAGGIVDFPVYGTSDPTSLFGDLTKSDRAYDGIFGFGQQGVSVISQLSSHGITPKVFSHCLKGDGNGGGILVLGEIMDTRIVYTPLVPSIVYDTGKQGTMVDSGTTLAYLVEGAYDPLVTSVTASLSLYVTPIVSDGKQCYLVSTSVTELFPPVSFNFAGGASLVLRPVDYLVQMGFSDSAGA